MEIDVRPAHRAALERFLAARLGGPPAQVEWTLCRALRSQSSG